MSFLDGLSGRTASPAQPGGQGGDLVGQIGQFMQGPGGKIALAALAYLASKNLGSGAGGYGSALHDMLTGHRSGGNDATAAPTSGGGGLLDQIGGMFGGSQAPAGTPSGQTAPSGQPDGSGFDGLGGMLGGAVSGGLNELQDRFRQSGNDDFLQSWIDHGPNKDISPGQLEQSLGPEAVDDMSRQTGMGRDDLLGQLAKALPGLVDKLTPNGRLPG